MAKLLVVEDDKSLMVLLQQVLPRWGLNGISYASSVTSAKSCIENSCPDMILTDFYLGDGTGADVIAFARQQNPEQKAIIMSGGVTPESQEAILACGADDFIGKPFMLTDLQIILQKHKVLLC